MSFELEESSVNNLSGHISGGIAMFDDSSLLVDNNASPDIFKPPNFDSESKTDHTIPPGWSGRGTGGSFVLRSPAGVAFRSRRAAFEDMVISGKYPDAEMEAMRNCLIHEGWEDSIDIPDGWKIKKRHNGIYLMEQGGRMLESSVKAHGFIHKHRKYYSDEDYQKIVILSKQKGHQKKIYMSPEPSQNYNPIHSELNRSTLTGDLSSVDTEVDEQETSSISISSSFMDQSGDKRDAEGHNTENYMPLINDEPIKQILVENQPQPEKKGKPRRINWQEDKLLYPPGWKYGVIKQPNKEPFSKFLSPSGSLFAGITWALYYMVTNNYPEEEIAMMRRAMVKHNWQQHNGLPENWFFKRQSTHVAFCDPLGRIFKSKDKAIAFISKEDDVDRAHLMMLQRFQAPSLLNIENDDMWKENAEVYPPGWKCKVIQLPVGSGGEKKYEKVMSPSGKLFKCRRAVLSHMITHQFPSEDIQKIQRAVEKTGWLISEFLPKAWTYKRKTGSGIEFSNEEGICMGSKDKTLKWLSKNPSIYLNEIQMVDNFFKQKTDSRLVELMQEKNNVDQQMIV